MAEGISDDELEWQQDLERVFGADSEFVFNRDSLAVFYAQLIDDEGNG